MPDYKVSGTATPNAEIVAYPHTDDVIYGTANATGAYEIQFNYGFKPSDYKIFYDTVNFSASEGVNSGYLGGTFANSTSSSVFNAVGFVNDINDGARFSGDADLVRFTGDLTIMVKFTPNGNSISWLVACDNTGESPETNWLYGIKFNLDFIGFFQEYGNGVNVSIDIPYSFFNGVEYIAEVKRIDNNNGTCDIYIFVDGVEVGSSLSQPSPSKGTSNTQVFTMGNASNYTDGFKGVIQKMMVDDTILTDEQRQEIRQNWINGATPSPTETRVIAKNGVELKIDIVTPVEVV